MAGDLGRCGRATNQRLDGARFLTRDPLVAATQDPYGYALNNPVNATDPTGLCGFLGDGPCTPGGIVDDLADRSPVRGQEVADAAAGVLDTISGGNADLILENVPGDQSTKVRWGSDAFQYGRVAGHVPAVYNLPAYFGTTTAGALINAGDSSIVCMMGRGGRACGADAAGAWFGFLAPFGAGRAGGAFSREVGSAAGLFADVFSTAVANGIDTFRRC